jgi:hypothetical protein
MSGSRSRSLAASHGTRAGSDRALERRLGLALWVALATLAVIRLVTAAPGSMAGWGFGLLRFSPEGLGWSAWLLTALALVPALSRPAALTIERVAAARALTRAAPWVLAVAAGFLAWSLPDRLRFVGDFLLRHGSTERSLDPSGLYPQAFPLEVLLHYQLPRALALVLQVEVDFAERLLGALEAGALGLLAVAFARALRQEGVRALAVVTIVLLGGYLGVYTGYGKAIAELALLTAAIAVCGIEAAEDPRWLAPLGVALAVSLTLHRSALAFLPAAAVTWALALRGDSQAWRRPAAWIGFVAPLATLAVMLPRIVTTMRQFDPVHFTPLDAGAGPLGALVAGNRPLDLLNLVAVVSPLGLAIPPLAATLGRRSLATSTGAVLGALALPWIAMTIVIHPPQGMFRDWDNYAAAGVSFSLIVAWLVAVLLAAAPSWRWLSLAAALAAAAPSLQWLAIQADVDRGLERVEAYLEEPPPRAPAERGRIWDFLGIRNAQLGRWDASAEALAHAAETSPSPRILLQWALAEQARGNSRAARGLFQRVITLTPDDARAWFGLAAESWNLGDYEECRRATIALERLRPGSPEARSLLDNLDQVEPHDGQAR